MSYAGVDYGDGWYRREAETEVVRLRAQLAHSREQIVTADAEVERLRAELGRKENLLGEYMDDRERLRAELDACQAQHMAQQTSSDYELGQQHAQAASAAEVLRLRLELARRDQQITAGRERDDQIESMIRYGHANEGYGTRAVMDIFTVLRGREFS